MDEELRQLHLNAGRKAGESRTCGTKIRYPALESAQRAAESMNAKPKTKNTLEPYPCPFCETWHIGRAMSLEELRSYVDDAPPDAPSDAEG
ncbi:MAG: hypothetical protein M4D80_20420 [Myxococcota bacterium]|nr:hypothetical protein [Myxococcota bacterium]